MARKKPAAETSGVTRDDAAASDQASTGEGSGDFESSLEELERIVAELESGKLTLTDSIERYQRGVGILKKCHSALDQVQQKIETLTRLKDDGSPVTEPFRAADPSQSAASGTDLPEDDEPDVDDRSTLF